MGAHEPASQADRHPNNAAGQVTTDELASQTGRDRTGGCASLGVPFRNGDRRVCIKSLANSPFGTIRTNGFWLMTM